MSQSISVTQARFLRLKSQSLIHNSSNIPIPAARLVKDIVGVQAQDLNAAQLSIYVRGPNLTREQVEQARVGDRSIVWTWLMRGTLHLAAREDIAWLLSLLGSIFIKGDQRRLFEFGWDDERAKTAIKIIRSRLEREGGLTRKEIALLLKENGFPHEGQSPAHLLYRAALQGILCAGPARDGKTTYRLLEDWIGKFEALPRQQALERLALRYLEAYAPARVEDFASWSGLPTSDAREAWQSIAGQIAALDLEGKITWMPKLHLDWLDEPFDQGPLVRLLPRFDTYLLGYANRNITVRPEYAKKINAGGGIISAVMLVDGEVKGTWKTRKIRGSLEFVVAPFESLPEAFIPLIQNEVSKLGRFMESEAVLTIANL